MDENASQQRGYLREDYRVFHLRDELGREVDSHYHEFHKLVFFRSGRVSYSVDGRASELQDGDIVEWEYTCELGKDIGGGYATGSTE